MITMKTKAERLAIYLARLNAAFAFATRQEALDGIASILNAVEDEFSGVPRNSAAWESDGRLYPPDEDFAQPDASREGVTHYRSRGHSTFIGQNGAVEIVVRIRGILGSPVYRRAGADGEFLPEKT